MSRKFLLYSALLLAATFASLHFLATMFHLYWAVGWYDLLMHFFGGFTLGIFVISLSGAQVRSWKSFLVIFLVVMAIALVWEVFEFVYDIAVMAGEPYTRDTIQDFVMDALGLVLSYFIFVRSRLSS